MAAARHAAKKSKPVTVRSLDDLNRMLDSSGVEPFDGDTGEVAPDEISTHVLTYRDQIIATTDDAVAIAEAEHASRQEPEEEPPTVVIDSAAQELSRELVTFLGQKNGADSVEVALARALSPDDLHALVALYIGDAAFKPDSVTVAKVKRDSNAFVDTVKNSPHTKALVATAEKHSRELLLLAQKVQRVFQTDVAVSKLTADEFQRSAVNAIGELAVLRSATMELGRVGGFPGADSGPVDLSDLATLVGILKHAAAHISVLPAFRERSRHSVARLTEELGKLQSENEALREMLKRRQTANDLAREMALAYSRVLPDSQIMPRQVVVTNPTNGTYLCAVRKPAAHEDGTRTMPLQALRWTRDLTRAIAFTSRSEALRFVDRVFWLDQRENPFRQAKNKDCVRGAPLADIRYGNIAVLVSNSQM